jgi:hypothetical protein
MATQPVTFDAPLKQPTTVAAPADVTFDSPVSTATSVTVPSNSTQPQTPAPQSHELKINPGDNLLTKTGKVVGGTFEGIGEGVFGTVAGASDLLDKATGMTPGAANSYLHVLAGDNETSHGAAQSIGRGAEDIGEFLLGDEALKGLSLSDRLLKTAKVAKVIEESPVLNRIVQAGVRALRGGTVAGAQTAVKTGGNMPDTLTAATTGAIGNAVVPEAFDALKAVGKALPDVLTTVRNVIKPGVIQDAFQGQIRDVVNDAAKELGVDTSNAASIRDVAHEVSDSLLKKARASYQALDEATGGRAQRFSDAIKAVQQKLRDLNGIATPDQEGAWIEKLNELTDSHNAVMELAKEAGLPADLLDTANATFKKSKAMVDLSKNIRASTEGLRPDLAIGAKSPIPERVNTGKLFPRVQKLYDSGRLQDALGQSRTADLLRAINDSHAATQLAESWRGLAKKVGGYAAAGALPIGGYELVRHLLGE